MITSRYFLFVFSYVLFAAPDDKGSIAGTAVDLVTGAPLGKVDIAVLAVDGKAGRATPFARTDAAGTFRLEGLEPGKYRLRAKRNGYLETFYSAKSSARRTEHLGTPITVEAGQKIEHLTIKVEPFAVISGTVRDPEGEPLVDASVEAFKVGFGESGPRMNQAANASTDDLGQFRIVNLRPGKYFVHAEPDSSHIHMPDEHATPSGLSTEILTPAVYPGNIEIKAGDRIAGVEITLPMSRTVAVRGRATVPAGTKLERVTLHSDTGANAELGLFIAARIRPNGEFEFRRVPAGSYTLSAGASMPKKPTTNMFELFSGTELNASLPVTVGGEQVENLQISVQPATEVSGRAVVDKAADASAKAVAGQLSFYDSKGVHRSTPIHPDGSFTTYLSPGTWNIDHRTGYPLTVSRVMVEGRNVWEEGLTISEAVKLQLEVGLSKVDGQVEGVVVDKDGVPVAGAMVVMVPELRLRGHSDLFLQEETDQTGHFQLKQVVPGKYKLFAWDDVESEQWFDTEFMKRFEAKGEPVTVEAAGHSSARLTVIAP